MQTNNYGARKFPRHDENIDDKDRKAVAVEEGLQVGLYMITKTKTPIKEMKRKRSKGTPPSSLTKLEHTSGLPMYTFIKYTMMMSPSLEVPHLMLSLIVFNF